MFVPVLAHGGRLHLISMLAHKGLRKYMFKRSPAGNLRHVYAFTHRGLRYVPKLAHRRVCHIPEIDHRGGCLESKYGVCLVFALA